MSITEKYRDFILDILGESHKTQLMEPYKKGDYINWKIGPIVYMDVNIEVLATYTRSAMLRITFDKYIIDQLFFMPLNSSPDDIVSKIYSKINSIVNKTLIDDNRGEEMKEMYNKRREKIFNKLEGLKLK